LSLSVQFCTEIDYTELFLLSERCALKDIQDGPLQVGNFN